MQEQIKIRLSQANDIIVYLGNNISSGLAVAKSLGVRRYDRSINCWRYPIESAPDVVNAFSVFKHVDIDENVLAIADRLSYLQAKKFELPTPDHALMVKTKCLNHQKQWLAWSNNFKTPACLNEQGTGKSKSALDWLDMKNVELAMIICRNNNVYKWASEIRKHSDYRPFILKGTRHERAEMLRRARDSSSNGMGSIAIINYEYVDPFKKVLSAYDFGAVVLDESTAIKNVSSKRHKAIYELSRGVRYRLILTGTPLVNSPLDAFGQFRFLNPKIFGDNFYAFRKRYVVLGGYGGFQILGYKNTAELKAKIDRYSFRVLKRDCLDLPPKIFEKLDCPPDKNFQKRYKDLVNAAILELGGQRIDNTLAISRINRCLQACDGFLYSPDGQVIKLDTPKDHDLIEILEDHFQGSNKVIIWAHFRATIKKLEALVSKHFKDIDVVAMMGGTPANISSANIDAFNDRYSNDNRRCCLILQSTAFMHGIDLRCDTAIYYGRNWSNEAWQQTQDRIHGINRGGDKSTYIILGIKGTVEDSVHHALETKKGLSDFLLGDVQELAGFLKGLVIGE